MDHAWFSPDRADNQRQTEKHHDVSRMKGELHPARVVRPEPNLLSCTSMAASNELLHFLVFPISRDRHGLRCFIGVSPFQNYAVHTPHLHGGEVLYAQHDLAWPSSRLLQKKKASEKTNPVTSLPSLRRETRVSQRSCQPMPTP